MNKASQIQLKWSERKYAASQPRNTAPFGGNVGSPNSLPKMTSYFFCSPPNAFQTRSISFDEVTQPSSRPVLSSISSSNAVAWFATEGVPASVNSLATSYDNARSGS